MDIERCQDLEYVLFIVPDNSVGHPGGKASVSQHFNFIFIGSIGFLFLCGGWYIRRLKDFGYICKIFVVHDIMESVKANMAKADIGMPVFGRTRHILTVIDMEKGNLFLAQQPVKLGYDIIKMMNDIITAVTCMAGIEADP